ncbi:MAG: DNA helicase UvrD [Deltaproteobacteria bacterium]|nr:DNA helicase UvrD [Deltaproteobacteria bacterium]
MSPSENDTKRGSAAHEHGEHDAPEVAPDATKPLPEPVEEERLLLATNLELLKHTPPEAELDTASIIAEMERLRDEIPTAQTDERPGLILQYERYGHLLTAQGRSLGAARVDPSSPYFAHMRLESNGKVRDVFLGKTTRLDHGLRIVDWRHAPVSTLFYRYSQGDEYLEEFGGRESEGTILLRRIVGIAEGELNSVHTPDGLYVRHGTTWNERTHDRPRLSGGEGLAARVTMHGATSKRKLGVGAGYRVDKHLPEISALIDAQQFEAITSDDAELVVVRGVAGSGKTTVALHRMAYLNYKAPGQFRADRMLVVVWGEGLQRFISKVLPSLGLPNARVMTYERWAGGIRRRLFARLQHPATEETPAIVTRLKLHPAMLRILSEYVQSRPGEKTASQVLDDWMEVLSDEKLLRDGLDRWAPGAFSSGELDRALRWTRQQVDLMSDWLEPTEDSGSAADREDGHGEDDGPKLLLDAEDDPLLLRLYQLRIGPLPVRGRSGKPIRLAHLVVDEVQDLSPLEVRVLMDCLDHKQSLTLAGDTQQHVLQEAGFADWEAFFDQLGVKGSSVNTLKVAYRSTAQIVEFGRKVLGDLAEDEAPSVVREGEPVELLNFANHGECIAFLVEALRELGRAEPNANVALLSRTEALADLYFSGLQRGDLPRLERVTRQDFSFGPGIEVCDLVQAKGLEFDYVILLDVSADTWPATPAGRRLLHVGATRAMHQLWVTSVGKASPLLVEASS